MDLVRAAIPAGAAGSLRFDFPGGPPGGPSALLSLRSEGDMRFRPSGPNPNRERFFRSIGLDPGSVLGLELAHSRRLLFPSSAEEHRRLLESAAAEGGADGLLLPRGSGLFASVTVADCMPIWILDRSTGAYGILHSGWKGTGILEAAVRRLAEAGGAGPAAIAAILGPAIGSCCYAVPEERALAFAAEFGAQAAPLVEGRPRIDLRAANLSIARRLGLGAVLSVEACTSCWAAGGPPGAPELFGSCRREGAAGFTRMAALIGPFARALPR